MEYMQRQEKLEGDQKNMAEAITTAQQKFADEKGKYKNEMLYLSWFSLE